MADILSSLAYHWKLNDNAASTAVANTVGGVDGTLTNAGNTSASSVAGPSAIATPNALVLDGTNDYIALTNIFAKDRTDPFTVAFARKSAAINPAANRMLITKGLNSGNYTGWHIIELGGVAGDPYNFQLVQNLSSYHDVKFPRTNDTNWHHCVVTNDGSGNASGMKWYEDGIALTPTVSVSTLAGSTLDVSFVQIGARSGLNTYPGSMADVRLYNRELSAADALALYRYVFGLAPFNTVAPVASGTGSVGSTLSSTNGTWNAESDTSFTYTYQWYVSDSSSGTVKRPIVGATDSTLVLFAALIGRYVGCEVTATNSFGSTVAYSNFVGLIRATVSAPTSATGPKHVKYNNGASGNLTKSFYRDQETVDEQAIVRAAGQRRFAKGIGYCPPTEWTQSSVQIATVGTVYIMGAGVDFDNETKLFVTYSATNNRIRVHKGDSHTQMSSTIWTATWIAGQPAGNTYYPWRAVVHHGFIGIYCQRSVSGVVKGVSFVYSQDYGATWTGVPIVGDPSSFDVPIIAGDVTSGQTRGYIWNFGNAFPIDGLDDIRSAWIPWADYIGSGAAGQAGIWKITRTTDTGQWTVHPNRLAFSDTFSASPGNCHIHAAAPTAGGLLLHVGDSDYRNHMIFVELDLDDYENATATPHTVFGGIDPGAGTTQRPRHAQPAGCAPHPTIGRHIAAADLGPEFVLEYGSMSAETDPVEALSLVHRPISAPGAVVQGFDALHISYCKQKWLACSVGIGHRSLVYSEDCIHWADVSLPDACERIAHICGDVLITNNTDRYVVTAPIPSFEKVKPLQISKGVTNLVAPAADWDFVTATAADNDWTQVYYDGSFWRYNSDDSLLEEQPPAPPFSHDAPVWLWESGSAVSRSFGKRYVQGAGDTIDSSSRARLSIWVCNLKDRGSTFKLQLGTGSSGQSADGEWGYWIGTVNQWMRSYGNQLPENTDRANVEFDVAESSGLDTGARSLVCLEGLNPNTPRIEIYPTPPETALPPHEIEIVSNFLTTINWTLGLVWRRPEEYSQDTLVIATLFKDSNDYIQIQLVPTTPQLAEVRALLVVDGVLEDTLVLGNNASTKAYPGELCELIISGNDNDEVFASCRNGSWPIRTDSGSVTLAEGYNHLVWGDENYIPSSVQPILTFVDGKKAYTEAEQAAWLAGTLAAKRGSSGQQLIGGQLVGFPIVGQQIVGNKLVY